MEEETKKKITEILESHLRALQEITVDDLKENPFLLMVVTESLKQATLLLVLLARC